MFHLPRLTPFIAGLALVGCGGGGGGDGGGTIAQTGCSVAQQKQFVFDVLEDWYFFNDFAGQTAKYASFDINAPADAQAVLDGLRYLPLDTNFSFLTTVESDQQFFGEGEFVGFGFGSKFLDPGTNSDLRVIRVFEGSPAAQAGFARGFQILEIDGRTIADISQAEGVNSAFGPAEEGVSREFRVRDLAGAESVVTVTKALFTIDPVPPVPARVIDLNGTPVGYLNLRTFISTAEPKLNTVFTEFANQNVQNIVIDVRYNSGGLVRIAEQLGDLLGGTVANGQIFSETRFYSARSNNNDNKVFAQLPASLPLLQRVVFLTTRTSASASELMINSMGPHTTVAVIGTATSGKPVGQSAFDCETSNPVNRFRAVTFEIVNSLGEGRYFDGIPATCQAEDDLNFPLGDVNEASLAAALSYIETGVCPPVPLRTAGGGFVEAADVPLGPGAGSAQHYAGAF